MRIRKLSLIVAFVLAFLGQIATAACIASPCVAGVFQWPYSPPSSHKSTPDQYTMQWNPDPLVLKYHLADDWNGIGGGNTDLGNPLYAIADGIVVDIDQMTANNSIGKVIRVRYLLPDGKQIDSVYMHVQSIYVAANAVVAAGQLIATIGDANGYYLNIAHLHWEVRTDLTLPLRKDPYYNPLTVATALQYTSPSLFVDDRASGGLGVSLLSSGAWTYFTVGSNAPSSTAFVQDQAGLRYSIKKAVEAGIIANWGVSWLGTDGVWYYNPDVTQVVFAPGVSYRILAQAPSLSLNVLYPGDRYRDDRARMDVVRAAALDSRFKNVLTETYGKNLAWDPNWELRWIGLNFLNNNGVYWTIYLYQTTYKANPLLRYTQYYDPNTGQHTPWREVGMNVLY